MLHADGTSPQHENDVTIHRLILQQVSLIEPAMLEMHIQAPVPHQIAAGIDQLLLDPVQDRFA